LTANDLVSELNVSSEENKLQIKSKANTKSKMKNTLQIIEPLIENKNNKKYAEL
jgi:hypothetical protein